MGANSRIYGMKSYRDRVLTHYDLLDYNAKTEHRGREQNIMTTPWD